MTRNPLTPEEAEKIRAEEKVRIQTAQYEKNKAGALGCGGLLALIGIGTLFTAEGRVEFLPWLAGGAVLAGLFGGTRGWFASGGGWGKFTIIAFALATIGYIWLK